MPPSKGQLKGRKKRQVRKLRRILILCEDTKSSRDYLERFPHDKDQVEIACIGTGMNTDSLMEDAIKRVKKAREEEAPYERVWVVFDRDSFPIEKFNRAFDLAENHLEITACWSNECFEIWYLLHFQYRDTGIGRHDLWPVISGLLGTKYDKADDTLHKLLDPRLDTALKNAKRLAYQNEVGGDPRRNPSTHVHELVEALRKLAPALQSGEAEAESAFGAKVSQADLDMAIRISGVADILLGQGSLTDAEQLYTQALGTIFLHRKQNASSSEYEDQVVKGYTSLLEKLERNPDEIEAAVQKLKRTAGREEE